MPAAAPSCKQSFKSFWSGLSATAAILPAPNYTHRSPKGLTCTKKKSVLYVILSKYVVQLISKNLLACWAGHMLKYFPETAPATTSPALIPSLPTSSQGGRATWVNGVQMDCSQKYCNILIQACTQPEVWPEKDPTVTVSPHFHIRNRDKNLILCLPNTAFSPIASSLTLNIWILVWHKCTC